MCGFLFFFPRLQMSNGSQGDSTTLRPRLFSVLGGAVTRASLQQLQRDVDVMTEVSCATTATAASARSSFPAPSHTQNTASSPPVQSLRQVLEVLRAAGRNLDDDNYPVSESRADPNRVTAFPATSAAAPSISLASTTQVRDTLMQAFGASTGSALYRECVVAPRRRIQRVVRQLSATVRARYIPFLLSDNSSNNNGSELISPSEPVDVHVQLYPSIADASMSAVPAVLRERGGFCGAVTIRRLAMLEKEAAAEQRLMERYMGVAAPGQTLASALSFWSDVSYGDTPPAALADYPPLGFELEEVAAMATTHGCAEIYTNHADKNNRSRGGGRRVGSKAPRSVSSAATAEAEDETAGPSLLLGLPDHNQALSSELTGQPTWVQPGFLLSARTSKVAEASRDGDSQRGPLPHITYPLVGVVAVLYIHSSGVAYVGYPLPPAASLANETTAHAATASAPAAAAAPPASASDGNDEGADQMERQWKRPRACTLPMLSATGFTRSLLGLS